MTWEERNLQQHCIDKEEQESKLITHAQLQIEALYELKDYVLPRDHSLFYTDLDDHLSQETTSHGLMQWIRTWEPVLLKSIDDAMTIGTRGMRSIRAYMTTITTTTTPVPHTVIPTVPPTETIQNNENRN